ncbi:MAG: hypothetical protein C7B46_06290 [Sulfobacillus benefaciens]|uniref:Uncharacterized protein n=1 Tax=Sulfobacillus benefaciens TaxID=453960 RepID=A0A2T2XI67_9FIRM|nr:MAG: hypothetical protein C7B46_06290 [Sulfobacillus benefaciens]
MALSGAIARQWLRLTIVRRARRRGIPTNGRVVGRPYGPHIPTLAGRDDNGRLCLEARNSNTILHSILRLALSPILRYFKPANVTDL